MPTWRSRHSRPGAGRRRWSRPWVGSRRPGGPIDETQRKRSDRVRVTYVAKTAGSFGTSPQDFSTISTRQTVNPLTINWSIRPGDGKKKQTRKWTGGGDFASAHPRDDLHSRGCHGRRLGLLRLVICGQGGGDAVGRRHWEVAGKAGLCGEEDEEEQEHFYNHIFIPTSSTGIQDKSQGALFLNKNISIWEEGENEDSVTKAATCWLSTEDLQEESPQRGAIVYIYR